MQSEASLAAVAPFWPGHDAAMWLGNFMGDVAWTIEPLLLLLVPLLRERALAEKQRARHAAAKKAD